MRVVIDTNCLESEELRVFLGADRSNFAVLPEHTIVEVFKPRNLASVVASYSVLCDFPRQVIVLKANRFVAGVNPRVAAISNRFIDRESTRSFSKFCDVLEAAKKGHASYKRQLAKRQEWARERVDSVQDGLGDQSEALGELRTLFIAEDLRRLGAGEKLSQRSRELILSTTQSLAERLAERQPIPLVLPRAPHRYYAFTWRYALCHLIQLVRLLSRGALRRAPAKARNDHFDNVFATFGTYYNGLMTNDADSVATQGIARIILRALGTRLADDYVESRYILHLLEELQSNSGLHE
jgi:hypothetical protein